MRAKLGLLWVLLGASTHAYADQAELYLSEESLQAQYATSADVIGLRAGHLTLEAFVNEEDDLMGAAGLTFAGRPAGATSWTFSAGPKLYGALLDVVDDSFVGVAVGGSASLPLEAAWPMWLTGQFHYAPKITTFGDAEDLLDFILRLEAQFVNRVVGFVGYRLFEAELEDGRDYDLDDDIHLGVRISF